MGKLESGHIKKGTTILVMPTKKTCEVVGIFEDENELQIAHNGDNVRLRLKGVSEEDIQPGYVLCGLKNPVHAVTAFEAQLQIVEYPSIMCAGYGSMMHAHTTREEVTIAVNSSVDYRKYYTRLTKKLNGNPRLHRHLCVKVMFVL